MLAADNLQPIRALFQAGIGLRPGRSLVQGARLLILQLYDLLCRNHSALSLVGSVAQPLDSGRSVHGRTIRFQLSVVSF
jgi:hypothetical protein